MQQLGRNKRTSTWIEKLNETQRKQRAKKVIGISINKQTTLNYEAVNDVKKDGFSPSGVSMCCNLKQKVHKGYVWKFL